MIAQEVNQSAISTGQNEAINSVALKGYSFPHFSPKERFDLISVLDKRVKSLRTFNSEFAEQGQDLESLAKNKIIKVEDANIISDLAKQLERLSFICNEAANSRELNIILNFDLFKLRITGDILVPSIVGGKFILSESFATLYFSKVHHLAEDIVAQLTRIEALSSTQQDKATLDVIQEIIRDCKKLQECCCHDLIPQNLSKLSLSDVQASCLVTTYLQEISSQDVAPEIFRDLPNKQLCELAIGLFVQKGLSIKERNQIAHSFIYSESFSSNHTPEPHNRRIPLLTAFMDFDRNWTESFLKDYLSVDEKKQIFSDIMKYERVSTNREHLALIEPIKSVVDSNLLHDTLIDEIVDGKIHSIYDLSRQLGVNSPGIIEGIVDKVSERCSTMNHEDRVRAVISLKHLMLANVAHIKESVPAIFEKIKKIGQP